MGNQRNPQTTGLVGYKTNGDFPELKAPRGSPGATGGLGVAQEAL